jgi:cytochrome P450
MADVFGAEDLEFYTDHFNILDPKDKELRNDAVKVLASKCPVTHSDAYGGYWIANSYEEVRSVLEDWQTFAASPESDITPRTPGRRPMYPLEIDPPIQREYRHVIQPYLTQKRLAQYEPEIRELVTELIDSFIEDGHVELTSQFAKPFVGRQLYRLILGLDETEAKKVRVWTDAISRDPSSAQSAEYQARYNAWLDEKLESRRNSPRQDDIIDAVLHATIDGRPLANDEVAGCLEVLIGGGFNTTSDVTLNIMLRLTQQPELRERLRNDLSSFPKTLDEFLRFDPPISSRARLCVRDTVLEGKEIKAGERIMVFLAPANRDTDEFSDPNVIDLDRERNRHLTFGLGVHRCIGSNLARLNLKIAFEELLTRLGEFEVTPGESVTYEATSLWGPAQLPLTFPPGKRLLPG